MIEIIGDNAFWDYQFRFSNTLTTTVPSSGWNSTGREPFGNGPRPDWLPFTNTFWGFGQGLWIKNDITLTEPKTLLISGEIENAHAVFWDGLWIGTFNFSNDPQQEFPEYQITIDSNLATTGTHRLAILALSDPGSNPTWLSVRVDAIGPVFPYQPEAPFKEKIEFSTDLFTAEDGTETALKLRSVPRKSYNLSFPMNFEKQPKANNLLRVGVKDEIVFPVWSEAIYRNIDLPSIVKWINFDTTPYSYADDGYAFIWSSDDVWQLVALEEVEPTRLVLMNLGVAQPPHWIMPAHRAYFPTGFRRVTDGYNSSLQLNCVLKSNGDKAVSTPTQYLGNDVFLREFDTQSGDSEEDVFTNTRIFDSGVGVVSLSNSWDDVRTARNMYFFNSSISEISEMKDFLYRRSGRYKSFWQPSFNSDLKVLNQTTITTSIDVKADGLDFMLEKRNHIAIEADGVWYLRQIYSYLETSPGIWQLNFIENLDIAPDTIKRVSWLGRWRLDTDSIEITYRTGGISTCSVRAVEVEV